MITVTTSATTSLPFFNGRKQGTGLNGAHSYPKEQAPSPIPKQCQTAASLVSVPAFVQLHGEFVRKLIWMELRSKKKTIKCASLSISIVPRSSILCAPLATAPRTGQNTWQEMKGKAGSLILIKAWLKNTEFRDRV